MNIAGQHSRHVKPSFSPRASNVRRTLALLLTFALALPSASFAQQPRQRILVPEEEQKKQADDQAGPRAPKPQLVLQTGVTWPAAVVAFSLDGQLLAALDASGSAVKLWDVASGRELYAMRPPEGSQGRIGVSFDLCFSPDGKTLTSLAGGTLRQWETGAGQQLRDLTLFDNQNALGSIGVISPDGRLTAAASSDGKLLRVWETDGGQQLHYANYENNLSISALAFSPGGRTLASVEEGYSGAGNRVNHLVRLALRDATSGQMVKIIKVSEESMTVEAERSGKTSWASTHPNRTIRFSPDGHSIAVAVRNLIVESDNAGGYPSRNYAGEVKVRLFDASSGREMNAINVASARRDQHMEMSLSPDAQTFAFSPDGKLFAAVSNDPTVKLFETASRREIATLAGGDARIVAVAFGAGGKHLATAGLDSTIKIWNVAEAAAAGRAELAQTLGSVAMPVGSLSFAPDGRALIVGGRQAVNLWDLTHGTARRSMTLPSVAPQTNEDLRQQSPSVISADGSLIAASGAGRTVNVWETSAGRGVRSLPLGGGRKLDGVALSRDGKLLAFISGVDYRAAPPSADSSDQKKNSGGRSIGGFGIGSDGRVKLDKNQKKEIERQVKEMQKQNKEFERLFKRGEHDKAMELALRMQQEQGAQQGRREIELPPMPGVNPQESGIRVVDLDSGKEIRRIAGQWMPLTITGNYIAFSPDGKWLASSSRARIKLHGIADNREVTLPGTERSQSIQNLAFSPDGSLLAAVMDDARPIADLVKQQASGSFPDPFDLVLKIWKVSSTDAPRELRSIVLNSLGGEICFSPDGSVVAVGFDEVKLFEVASGRELARLAAQLTGSPLPVTSMSFSPDSKLLVSGGADGGARLWNARTGELLATLVSLSAGSDWLVITPDGLFDGTPAAWNRILWRFSQNLTDVTPVEAYFNEFFHPGLLAEIYAGKRPRAAQDVARKDRRQPVVTIARADGQAASVSSRTVRVKIGIAEPKGDPNPAGAQDVRLFRNGMLVKAWRGDALRGRKAVTLEAELPIVAGENRLMAYAFNHDNVKSSDALIIITGAESLRRQGAAWVIACGVNQYDNAQYNLKYAVADATSFADEVKAQQVNLRNYANTEIIPLLDQDATKANILLALRRLAGDLAALPAGAPPSLAKLRRAEPEDAVIIYFAGHGTARGARFYLVPHDLGYAGARNQLTPAAVKTILARSISDLELEAAVESLDAGQMVLVIDACNSGQALEAEEKRRGPMNSKGLAQLAYEKGLFILTAAQSYQAALEAAQLGHGYLTFALVEEGLKTAAADRDLKDGLVLAREWFDYAAERVPQMQEKEMQSRLLLDFADDEAKAKDPKQRNLQRPRVFYRRETEARPLVVAKPQ